MPLERARAKLAEIERELMKCADFQFYLVAKSGKDRVRMKRLLMEIPTFRHWRALTIVVRRARSRAAASMIGREVSTEAPALQGPQLRKVSVRM